MTASFNAVVTDYIESELDWEVEVLGKQGIGFAKHQLKGRSEDEVFAAVKDADVIVVNMVKFPASLIGRLDRCKVLIRHGIGYDNVDVDACTRQGIQFAYQPDYCAIDVAEHAITLLLACARQIPRARTTLDVSAKNGEWDFSGLFPLYRMEEKTVGILGLGRIGSIVARKLSNFGFRLIGHDPRRSDAELEERGVTPMPIADVFSQADFLTIHTPLEPQTRHLINAKSLATMKPTSYVINTARGGIVDAEALADAVRRNVIAGAAIDVYDVEPPPPDHPLFGLDRAILTPHSGWASVEAEWAIRKSIVNDIIAASKGQDARCVVNSVRREKESRT